jgi:DNA processing protein
LELGHDVFAVPGSIHLSLSAGAHQLIRQGAGLVASPTELLFDMGILDSTAITQTLGRRGRRRETAQDPRLSPVLETLEWTGQSAAVIASRLQWPLQDALVGLLLAENCSQARRLPNGDWVRFQDHR